MSFCSPGGKVIEARFLYSIKLSTLSSTACKRKYADSGPPIPSSHPNYLITKNSRSCSGFQTPSYARLRATQIILILKHPHFDPDSKHSCFALVTSRGPDKAHAPNLISLKSFHRTPRTTPVLINRPLDPHAHFGWAECLFCNCRTLLLCSNIGQMGSINDSGSSWLWPLT